MHIDHVPIEASVPQGSILAPILWNIYFIDLLQSPPLASAYADDCMLSHSYTRDETMNVIDDTNQLLGDITSWAARWQVKFAAEKTQAVLIPHLREDAKLLEGHKVWRGHLCHLGLGQHPRSGSRLQTLLPQPLDTDDLMKLCR